MLQFSNSYANFQINEQLRKKFWTEYKVLFLESLGYVKAVIKYIVLVCKMELDFQFK